MSERAYPCSAVIRQKRITGPVETRVTVLGETPERYRTRFEETANGWREGGLWLAPKHMVTFAEASSCARSAGDATEVEPRPEAGHPADVPRETLVAIAAAVKAYQARTGESQTEMAQKLGMKQPNLANQLGRLERGEPVAWDTAETIANHVGYELVLAPKTEKGGPS